MILLSTIFAVNQALLTPLCELWVQQRLALKNRGVKDSFLAVHRIAPTASKASCETAVGC